MLMDQEGENHIVKISRFHAMTPEDASKNSDDRETWKY